MNHTLAPLDPMLWGVSASFRRSFVPLGVVLEVESNDPMILSAASESFKRYGVPNSDMPPEFRIRLLIDPVHHQGPPWPPPSFRAIQHLFHISCGNANFAIADLRSKAAAGFVSPELAQDSSFLRNTFLECLFHAMVVFQYHTPVHCAVVAVDGNAVLLCGPSGAGKSSLAYACAKAGLKMVSDDFVFLCPNKDGHLIIWGRPWHLRLLPDSAELFPELKGRPAHLRSDYEWYLEIEMDSEFPGQSLVSCTPAALVFLEEKHEGRIRLEPIPPELALERLGRDIYPCEETVRMRHFRTLRSLTQVQAFALRHGGHPSAAVNTIADLCKSLPPESAFSIDSNSFGTL